MKIKTIINKWDLIKLKSFYTTKENYKPNDKTTHGMVKKYLQMMGMRRD